MAEENKLGKLPIIMIGVFAGVLSASMVVGVMSQSERREKERQEQSQMIDRAEAAIKDGKANDAAGLLETQADKLSNAGKTASGDDKIILECGSEIMRKMQAMVAGLAKDTEQLTGVMDANFNTAAEADRRLGVLASYAKQNAEMDRFISGMQKEMESSFVKRGMAADKAAKVSSNMANAANVTTLHKIRECDREFCEQATLAITLMKDNLGKWKVENEVIVFDSDAVSAKYQAAAERIQKVAADQTQAQQELIAAARAKIKK